LRCELTHLERVPIDLERARAEHASYEDVLRRLGCHVTRLPATDDMADSVFIEDTAVVLDEMAVLARPGAPSRRAEVAAVGIALRSHRPIAAILPSGTIDGGDVLRAGRRLFVGVGARTNADGAKQLRGISAPFGYSVEETPFEGCLHLKTAATSVADDLVLVNPEWVDPGRFAPLRTIAVDPAEPFAANALRIGADVVYPAEYPRTRARLEAAGLRVHGVAARELAKAEGGVTCCSLVFAAAH
jgi:dimethylargininase